MKAIRLIQLIWAVTLVGILVTLSVNALVNAQSVQGLPFLLLTVVYLSACIRAWGSSRIAWVIALVVPVVICARWLPMVAINLFAFVRDDPLYLDSPGTIFIVAIYALLLVIPSLVLLVLFWLKRAALQALFDTHRLGAA